MSENAGILQNVVVYHVFTIKRFLIGRPLNHMLGEQKLNKLKALAILSSDAFQVLHMEQSKF